MNDLDLIRALGDLDTELDRLQRERDKTAAHLPDAERALAGAQAALDAVDAEIAALGDQERAAAREVGLYEKRRATATRALEQGLGDPESAQRQVDQCSQILDDLETRQLEFMEQAELLAQTRTARTAERDQAAAELAERQRDIPPVLAELDRQRDALLPDRQAAHGALPKELQLRYDLVRTKKRTAVAPLRDDDSCGACRLRAPVVEAADARRGLLKSCKGCGRFLVPPA